MPAQGDDEAIPPAWGGSDRFVPTTFVQPVQRFMRVEAAGAVVMLVAAVVALAWANSAWRAGYASLWSTPAEVTAGFLHLELSLREWVNDGAMALFFFLVALEIKRELVLGELREPRAAALPALAALGGMVVPALIYLSFNVGTAASAGWGIPMATDIAFAVGVVSLLGSRVPTGAKLFLLVLAIVDDLGAIAVIAAFYTDRLSLRWLGFALLTVAAAAWLQRSDVRSLVPYIVLGVVAWCALQQSGVHATLTGVAFGFVTPAAAFYPVDRFGEHARRLVAEVERSADDGHVDEGERDGNALRDLVRLARESESPLDRTVHGLAPWVSFGVVPLFALANAGVALSADAAVEALSDRVFLGVVLGLLVGKPVGILLTTAAVCRLRLGSLPPRTTWFHMAGVSVCAAIGFTVALFITALSFDDPGPSETAKMGVLAVSVVAGGLGWALLRLAPAKDEPPT